MAIYELLVREAGRDAGRFMVDEQGIVIGRKGPDVNIDLNDPAVSRRHARVFVESGDLIAEDLGSRNGIFVNNLQVSRAVLHETDELRIGNARFRSYRLKDPSASDSTITYVQGNALYEHIVTTGDATRLPILYKAAKLLASVFDQDDLLNQILTLIFEAVPARRGFVLIVNSETKIPEVRATLTHEGEDPDLPLSKTLIQRVLSQKDALITYDAQEDSRFDATQSIVAHSIRSAICVPLCGQESAIGAVYIDSGVKTGAFSKDDLELLMAVGRVVGVAVENAQLHQAKLNQERLAAIGLAMANVGHCVKNILTGLKGAAEIIERATQAKDWQRIEWCWPVLKRSVDRVELMMLNMLMFSKTREPEREPTDLNGVMQEVVETVRFRGPESGVTLECESRSLPIAWVDKTAVYRAVLNLVMNAAEACEQNRGTVTVTCHGDEDGHTIEVRDTGPGIAPDLLPKIFETFSSSKGSRGTGLGLACCQKIAREHGGSITCESELGKGSVFSLFLPAQDNTRSPGI